MSEQKYAGRHRPLATSAGTETPALLSDVGSVEPVRSTSWTGSPAQRRSAAQVTPCSGRHRTASTSSLPRIAGTGLLLPTAAAATLVLTATGAHLASSTVDLAPNAVQAQTAATLAGQQETQEIKVNALAALSRGTQQRADRDNHRERLSAVAAENVRRQAHEQARLDASGDAMAISKIAPPAPPPPSPRRWVPYLDASYTLTSGFGMRWGALHPGQDFALPVGTPVMAMSTGTVLFAGWSGGYGNKVEIQYWDGTVSSMAHNSALKVTTGEQVSPGEVVALSGNTGHSTGPHSHLEIHLKGGETNVGAVPPIPWLNAKGIMPGAGGVAAPGTGATD